MSVANGRSIVGVIQVFVEKYDLPAEHTFQIPAFDVVDRKHM